jgi:hypothetical protein
MTMTVKLLGLLNKLQGKSYPDIGYMYHAAGIGHKPAIWVIVNNVGGVTSSDLNMGSPKKTCNAIRGRIIKLHQSIEDNTNVLP